MPVHRRNPSASVTPPVAAPTDAVHADEGLHAPGPLLMMLEGRAPMEYAALLAASPWLHRLPPGDGHPVLVFPGLGASDLSTLPLRHYLRRFGYTPYPWGQGFNFGPRHGALAASRELLAQLHDRHREKPSLIGWSLGGIYARELAKEMPDRVRCVITLGTPFSGHPRATNAWRFYELVSGQQTHDDDLLAQIRVAPPVPTTSIYSRSDGVVSWRCCLNDAAEPLAENVEVHASHVGMGMNPLALYAIADRLAQDPARWRRFDAQGAWRWLFPEAEGTPLAPGEA
jgi:pimeloyl-ACP methyl ester carboxylesterase